MQINRRIKTKMKASKWIRNKKLNVIFKRKETDVDKKFLNEYRNRNIFFFNYSITKQTINGKRIK